MRKFVRINIFYNRNMNDMRYNTLRIKRFAKITTILLSALAFVMCVEDPTSNEGNGNGSNSTNGDDSYEDIKVVDGKVRFYIEEKANATRTASGLGERGWSTSKVSVNGKNYEIQLTDEQTPRRYVEVEASNSARYDAVLLAASSSQWYEGSAYSGVRLSHAQIYHMMSAHIRSFPMYATYTKESGNKLIFNDGFAMILLKLKGSAKISSVKVESLNKKAITGIANFMPSKGAYTLSKGFDFAVLNSTNKGEFVQLDAAKDAIFRLMIAPGDYVDGLKMTICDSERGAMFVTLPALNLAAGDIHTVEKEYECDPELVYYEDFDNFVWGGDVMKGENGFGFSPQAGDVTIDSGVALNGYESAMYEVAYDVPGTGFIQSNAWASVSDKSVGESHQMSDSYVASRNIADMVYMFRTQEHPGYIAVGAATQDRGIFQTSIFKRMKTIARTKIIVDFALQPAFDGELLLQILDGGVIESASINGSPIELSAANLSYRYNVSICNIKKEQVEIPATLTAPKEWNRLELTVNGVTDGSKLYIADNISAKGVHGIYIDRIEVREIEEWGKKSGTVRVLLWNILAGMWCDQHNNYDNFVEWVKKYDPDICIWCESETIYYDDPSKETMPEAERYLPKHWGELAARFGHNYAEVGGNRDNYSQTLTSKFPITVVKKITDTNVKGKPVSHGAGHFTIDLNGKKLNIVTLHMWPMAYALGTSTSNTEGDQYRAFEMQYIVDNTVNHSNYAGEEYWLMAGDTNAHSPLDSWYYGYEDDDTRLLTHKIVRNQTNLKDVIGDRYPANHFMESYPTHNRIDFIYVSPAMFGRIDNGITLIDEWCRPRRNGNVRNWYAPADHRPLLVDFVME